MSYPALPNAAPISDALSPLYFLHIPKTAGTTFSKFLAAHFKDDEVCSAHLWRQLIALPPADMSAARLIWGHFYSFLFMRLPTPTRYLVFLRDPIERAISHYAHILSHEEHYFHRRALALGSFRAFLRDSETGTTVNNFQVRSLALDLDPQAIAETLTLEERSQGELERRLLTSPFDRPLTQMLETAKIRLKQMCFVGITERYDESINLFCNRFHWPSPGYSIPLNVNRRGPNARRIGQDDLALLRRINQADCDLYAFACQLFASDLADRT